MLHHVYNRGIAHRTVFERRTDVRTFLKFLVCESRAGRVEVLAYAFLTTHYHLVLRSTTGELAAVMQRVISQYVRYFNRTRGRDGPLFRTRYQSKPVLSTRYLWTLIRYVDQNATEARLTAAAVRYPFGSAGDYAAVRRPPWLSTEVVDDWMGRPEAADRARAYQETLGDPLRPEEVGVIESRLRSRGTAKDEWDSLIEAAPDRMREWMRHQARIADGTKPGLPYADASRVDRVLAAMRVDDETWRVAVGKTSGDAWPIARIGLYRDLAGMTMTEIARRCERTQGSVKRRIQQHLQLLTSDEAYAEKVAVAAVACLRPV